MSSDYTTFSGSLFDELQSNGDTTLVPDLRLSYPHGRTRFESSPTPPSPVAFGRRSPDVASTSSRHSSHHSRHGSGVHYAEHLNNVRFNTPTGLLDSRSDQRLQVIALADEDALLRSRNGVYLACIQQTEQLKMECTGLKVKAAMYKKLYDDLLQKFPQLIGINGAANPLTDDTASGPSQSPARSRVIFGHGLELPTVPLPPPGIAFKFWHRSTWTSRKKIPQARQYNNDDMNVAQIYAEDETGQPVSGLVAREMRQTVARLLHSLRWSGQVAPTASELMQEAYVYLHAALAHRFPFLLFCEAGQWKIDTLISQVYSGFKTNHLAKADVTVKAESISANLSSSSSAIVTKSNTKRERSPSATASTQPRKKVAGDIHMSTSDSAVVQARPTGSSSSGPNHALNSSRDTNDAEMVPSDSMSLETPAKQKQSSQMVPITKRYTVSIRPPHPAAMAPTAAAALAPTMMAAPASNPAPAAPVLNVAGVHATVAPTDVAAPASVLTFIGAGAATTPVTAASVTTAPDTTAADTTTSNSTTPDTHAGAAAATAMLASSGALCATSPPGGAPADNVSTALIGPSAITRLSATSSTPAPFSQQATGIIERSSAVAAAAPPVHTTDAPISALPPPIPLSDSVLPSAAMDISNKSPSVAPKSKSWTKVQSSKAVIKFKPDTISEKNLHMKSMIDANSDVTVGECAESFAKLTNREFENLKADVQALRREKRTARNPKQ